MKTILEFRSSQSHFEPIRCIVLLSSDRLVSGQRWLITNQLSEPEQMKEKGAKALLVHQTEENKF
jgi:hypothetical protein